MLIMKIYSSHFAVFLHKNKVYFYEKDAHLVNLVWTQRWYRTNVMQNIVNCHARTWWFKNPLYHHKQLFLSVHISWYVCDYARMFSHVGLVVFHGFHVDDHYDTSVVGNWSCNSNATCILICETLLLTDCGLMTVNIGSGDGLLPDAPKHYLNKYWPIIKRSSGIHLRAISQKIPQPSMNRISPNQLSKNPLISRGTHELTHRGPVTS